MCKLSSIWYAVHSASIRQPLDAYVFNAAAGQNITATFQSSRCSQGHHRIVDTATEQATLNIQASRVALARGLGVSGSCLWGGGGWAGTLENSDGPQESLIDRARQH
ncbi:hypothetical protein J3458_004074 [Metarhizium acridum]|uniref:uncharacterized protein n=1 Tax=Metarhizium acridum TaxID=92637 RepID=UPI001C6C43FE|nr:hypothetical protein J3458_004074 [Metarhizium acridum]